MKKRNIIFLALFLLFPVFLISPAQGEKLDIVRLHIIAQSDDAYDQYIKLRVRDGVLDASQALSLDGNAADEIENNLSLIEDAARVVLASYGVTYSVHAQFGEFDFPAKTYGNVTLPAGKYTAVRVVLGNGGGQNWWCVMYPPLCFTSETTANFDKETVDLITKSGSPQFKIKFKILELLS